MLKLPPNLIKGKSLKNKKTLKGELNLPLPKFAFLPPIFALGFGNLGFLINLGKT